LGKQSGGWEIRNLNRRKEVIMGKWSGKGSKARKVLGSYFYSKTF
jgi:hypothetical protein